MVLKYLQVIKSQTEIAQRAGTTSASGTYVYKVRDTLNFYLSGEPYMYVNINQVSFENSLKNTLQLNKPSIFHVKTGVLPEYNNLNYGHYVVGTGYFVQWSLSGQSSRTWYNDPYNSPSLPNIYGQNTVDTSTMATAIKNNAGYIFVGIR